MKEKKCHAKIRLSIARIPYKWKREMRNDGVCGKLKNTNPI
jgi:hypothetical protein